ncbi:MAG: SPASM domain-containing protein, partial [Bdellovibrionota bacterium]
MIDLLLEDAPDCVTENFGPVESSQANRWRWALGARQTLRFKPPPAGGRVHFEISLPAESSRLILSLAGLELRRFAGKEKYSGYFDLPASGEAWAEVSFVSAAWNESRNRFAPDDRPLAFSISRFTLVERDPEFSLEQMKRVVEGGVAPPALCSVPFTHFYINEGGTSYPCCELVLDVCTNEDEFGGTKVRSKDDLPKAWNSPLHRSLRRSMLSGREPAVCRACYQSEKAGANSLRKMLSGRLPEAMLAAKEMGEDGSLPLTPQVLDFRLGNTCNLKCRMCSPGFSAGLVPEFSELTGKDFSAFRHVDWHKRPGFLSEVAEFCSTIRELRIMGGEPF